MLDAIREWLTVDDEQIDEYPEYDRNHVDQLDHEHLATGDSVPALCRCDLCGRLFDDVGEGLDHVADHERHAEAEIDVVGEGDREVWGPSDADGTL